MSVPFQLVPFIVEVCVRMVEEKGLDNQGIYRVPGNTGAIKELQDEINKVVMMMVIVVMMVVWTLIDDN